MPFSLLPFSFHVVKGHSMQPRIKEGERVVVYNWAYAFTQPKVGDVVVFSSSDKKRYMKRISAVGKSDELIVEGNNKADSKKMPPVKRSAVVGRVIGKY